MGLSTSLVSGHVPFLLVGPMRTRRQTTQRTTAQKRGRSLEESGLVCWGSLDHHSRLTQATHPRPLRPGEPGGAGRHRGGPAPLSGSEARSWLKLAGGSHSCSSQHPRQLLDSLHDSLQDLLLEILQLPEGSPAVGGPPPLRGSEVCSGKGLSRSPARQYLPWARIRSGLCIRAHALIPNGVSSG